ncbi:cytochrome C oxidase subunit IV family protein [bacterium]|nr:cytochrome C oxidase subunit IV family protein [bacterium]
MAALTYDEKIKTYIKVAIILAVITVVEVGLTFVPHAEQPMKTIITMAIVALSCSKAFFVAYYYMHLNHEKPWTIWVAASPLCILIYVGALIADTPSRPISIYEAEPARGVVYPTTSGQGDSNEHAEAHAGMSSEKEDTHGAPAQEEVLAEPEEGGEWE